MAATLARGPGIFVAGAGVSGNAVLSISGTIGQPVATSTASVGGTLGVQGGVWPVLTPAPNTPPTLLGATNAVTDELVGFVRDLAPRDVDVPVQALTVALVSGPTGLVVTNGVLAWTPTEVQGPSTNEVRVSVTDGVVTVTNVFNVVVREVNGAPVVLADVVERRVGQGIRVALADLLANDVDPEGDVLRVTAVAPLGSRGGTGRLSGDVLEYTPPTPDVAGLDDVVWYEVSDGKGGVARGQVTVRATGPSVPTAGPLRIRELDASLTRLELRFETKSGRTYRLERASGLGGPWELVATLVGDSIGEASRAELVGAGARFFRVVEP